MTLGEAIKILTPDSEEHFEAAVQELEEAERLGIQALKRIKDLRRTEPPFKTADELLAGETKSS